MLQTVRVVLQASISVESYFLWIVYFLLVLICPEGRSVHDSLLTASRKAVVKADEAGELTDRVSLKILKYMKQIKYG